MPVHRPKPGSDSVGGGNEPPRKDDLPDEQDGNELVETNEQIEALIQGHMNMREAHAAALIEAQHQDFRKRWRERHPMPGGEK